MSLRTLLNQQTNSQVQPPTSSDPNAFVPTASVLTTANPKRNGSAMQIEDDEVTDKIRELLVKKVKLDDGSEVPLTVDPVGDVNTTKRVITYLEYPKILSKTPNCGKAYSVRVNYRENGKHRTKLVRFGKIGKAEFIDDGNEAKRQRKLKKLRMTDDFLDDNFYIIYLLNSGERSLFQAYGNLLKALNLEQQRDPHAKLDPVLTSDQKDSIINCNNSATTTAPSAPGPSNANPSGVALSTIG